MMSLGVICVGAGISIAVAANWSVHYRAILEMFGGSLFVVGLGCAGASMALIH